MEDYQVKAHEEYVENKIEKSSTVASSQTTRSRLPPNEKFPNINEKKLLRKMDLHIIPLLSILYLLAYLDRGNIGNAKIEGLAEDLNLKGNQYNIALTVFFISYCVFEVPSNMALKKLKPSIWLPIIMIAWGVVMTLMGIVQDYHGLVVSRLFLGVAEAGLFPGVAYYLTNWYCRHELQYREALFYAAASIAGAFSGILAFGISKMHGVGGLEGWRWIFILEGILTVVVACISFFFLHDFPETAKFLTEEERQYVIYKLEHDNNTDSSVPGLEQADHTSSFFEAEVKERGWKYAKQAFKDWQIYVHVLVFYGIVAPTYGVALFLPTIILNLGYTSAKAQLMSIPVYVVASIVSVVQAWFSDRFGRRSPFLVVNFLTMLVGFCIAIGCDPVSQPGAIYAGVFIAASGMYPAFPTIVSWMANNLAGDYKRAVGMALHIGLGNFGGTFGSNFYRTQDGPHYTLGHGIAIGFIGLGLVATFVLIVIYTMINKKREKDILEGKYKHYTAKQLAEMGDKNPYFRYRI